MSDYGAVPKDEEEEEEVDRGIEMPFDDATPTCRDPIFAILFIIHLVFVVKVGMEYGSFGVYSEYVFKDDGSINPTVGEFSKHAILHLALPCAVLGFLLSFLMAAVVLPASAEIAIQICFLLSVVVTAGLGAALCYHYQYIYVYIGVGLALLFVLWYVCQVWRMIPFAAVNLRVALKGMTLNWGTYLIALLFGVCVCLWGIAWFYVENGLQLTRKEGNFDDSVAYYSLRIFILFSLFWTFVVLLNTSQVTVAGVTATFCFDKADATSGCSPAVVSAIVRALTYSFGSICFGSLLEAIIKTLRAIAEKGKEIADSDGNKCDFDSIFIRIITCCLRCCEGAINYFNQWAYVYVGIYGYSYLESGRRVFELFRARGWTALVTNNLVTYVLGFTSIMVAILTGLVGILLDNEEVGFDGYWDSFGVGFVVGFVVSHVMMNVVKGAVNTVIVCFGDEPEKMMQNHPILAKEMAEDWIRAFPDFKDELEAIL